MQKAAESISACFAASSGRLRTTTTAADDFCLSLKEYACVCRAVSLQAYLMPGNAALIGSPIIGQHLHDLSICQSVPSVHRLAVDLGAKHLVAHVRVHVVGKIYHCSTLQTSTLPLAKRRYAAET